MSEERLLSEAHRAMCELTDGQFVRFGLGDFVQLDGDFKSAELRQIADWLDRINAERVKGAAGRAR